jgi:hypothetical protein
VRVSTRTERIEHKVEKTVEKLGERLVGGTTVERSITEVGQEPSEKN